MIFSAYYSLVVQLNISQKMEWGSWCVFCRKENDMLKSVYSVSRIKIMYFRFRKVPNMIPFCFWTTARKLLNFVCKSWRDSRKKGGEIRPLGCLSRFYYEPLMVFKFFWSVLKFLLFFKSSILPNKTTSQLERICSSPDSNLESCKECCKEGLYYWSNVSSHSKWEPVLWSKMETLKNHRS
jgi:hypothetical protein